MSKIPERTRRDVLAHPWLTDEDRPVVARFLDACETYSDLEQHVLGDLQYDLPVHQVATIGGDERQLREEAELLADAARLLLGREAPVRDLAHALEEHGARIFGMPLSHDTRGLFVFVGEVAPAFLVNSRLNARGRSVVLAELYGHYLADNDPYLPRVMSADDALADEAAMRAGYFAEELLLPVSLLDPLLDESVGTDVIADYVDLPPSFVARRLVSFGVTTDVRAPRDLWGGQGETLFPERLVGLALEGIHEGRLSVDEFADVLQLSREAAIDLLRLSSQEDSSSTEVTPNAADGEAPVNGGPGPS